MSEDKRDDRNPNEETSGTATGERQPKDGQPRRSGYKQAVDLAGLLELLKAGDLRGREFMTWCAKENVKPRKLVDGKLLPMGPEDHGLTVLGLAEPHTSKGDMLYPESEVAVLMSTAVTKPGFEAPYTETTTTTTTSTEKVVKMVSYATAPGDGTIEDFAGKLVKNFLGWCAIVGVNGKKRVRGSVQKISASDHDSYIEKNDPATPAGAPYYEGQDVIVILEAKSRS